MGEQVGAGLLKNVSQIVISETKSLVKSVLNKTDTF